MTVYKKFNEKITPHSTAKHTTHVLNIVTQQALSQKDTESLIEISKLWMNMVEVAQHLNGYTEEVHNVVGFSRKEDEDGRTHSAPTN